VNAPHSKRFAKFEKRTVRRDNVWSAVALASLSDSAGTPAWWWDFVASAAQKLWHLLRDILSGGRHAGFAEFDDRILCNKDLLTLGLFEFDELGECIAIPREIAFAHL